METPTRNSPPPLSGQPLVPKVEDTTKPRDRIPDEDPPLDSDHFQILNCAENIEKYKKYEEDYSCRLISKYFSDKTLQGDKIYDMVAIGDENIMSSRWPCTLSFADPSKILEERNTFMEFVDISSPSDN